MFGASLHVIPHDGQPSKLRKSSEPRRLTRADHPFSWASRGIWLAGQFRVLVSQGDGRRAGLGQLSTG